MLPPCDKRHGPGAQPCPAPLPEDSTVSTKEGGTIGAPGAKATLQQQTDVGRGCDEAPARDKTIGETSGTTGVFTGPSAGDDSRRQTDGSEDKEEKGMYAEPSKEESSCRQSEPNTRDASALPDGDFLAPRGAASVLSRTQPRVRGTLATFPEETNDAREPGAPSRNSTNPVLGCPDPVMACSGVGNISAVTVGSTRIGYLKQGDLRPDSDITPVFTAAQIEAISRGDMTGLPDSQHVDIEERLYPLSPADLELQLKALRSQRKDVTHADIVRVVTTALKRPLTEADNILFDSPVDIDDPERWLDWFSTTLNTCEEARTANRNFEQERVAMVADTRWSRMFRNGIGAAELAGIGPSPDLQGTASGVLAAIGLLAPSADVRLAQRKGSRWRVRLRSIYRTSGYN
ncbi:hypothetical protein DYB36_013375 [Aphanomyces astaci]|uniref:Uncharacterized protein n=1 Tax=Aphanomyces astaci TaxID=112090 RepID=A0A397ADD1_APHAT|nr:hypothetical protein DYB36_013375 [Aphanomyces astaci]